MPERQRCYVRSVGGYELGVFENARGTGGQCFAEGGGVVKRYSVLTALAFFISLVFSASPAPAATYTKVVRYGAFTLPAATDAGPGMIHNQLKFAVQRPCLDCYITSFTPDLVYPDGTKATMDTGAMLHHFVLTSQFRSDATCGNTLLGLAGERFFASGNERTAIAFPYGYGYRVRWYDSWNLLVDLMNHSTSAQTVYVLGHLYLPSSLGIGEEPKAGLARHRSMRRLRVLDPRGLLRYALGLERQRSRQGHRGDRASARARSRDRSHERERGRRIHLQVGGNA